ncbi:hypothetical protein [Vibrio fluvialis]|uniref:hypothetical protein n=1 Tax=Vibrio fluvialis TaxID=676 RepID=UPI001C9C34AA|nr:hypothetical protein [Vibrio fluvialis]MBY8107403.1 hypothetical protein [Vibrio fluvialis]MCE7596361.1 hypothetical protein [Vibrio fluvialis]
MNKNYISYIKEINKFLSKSELENVRIFMLAKTFIGFDVSFFGEPFLVCKLPLHIIKNQFNNPDFKVYGFYKETKLIALMIKIHDLKVAPYVIFSNFVPPVQDISVSKFDINSLSFINEVNEPVLEVEVEGLVDLPNFANIEFEPLLSKSQLLQLPITSGVTCRLLCSAKKTMAKQYLIHRDTDQQPHSLHILASEIVPSGEDTINGHGRRLEDLVHFKASALKGVIASCGLKYAMNPTKSLKPNEELCDELIIYKNTSIFIQAKSIITKPRLRDSETISKRIDTTIKRINKAAEQLCQHIKSLKAQNYSIITTNGTLNVPKEIIGIVIISETFEGDEYNHKINEVLYSDPILREIKLTVMSAEEFCWLVTCCEGNIELVIESLKDRFNGFIEYGRYGTLPCDLSIACRIPEHLSNQMKKKLV